MSPEEYRARYKKLQLELKCNTIWAPYGKYANSYLLPYLISSKIEEAEFAAQLLLLIRDFALKHDVRIFTLLKRFHTYNKLNGATPSPTNVIGWHQLLDYLSKHYTNRLQPQVFKLDNVYVPIDI